MGAHNNVQCWRKVWKIGDVLSKIRSFEGKKFTSIYAKYWGGGHNCTPLAPRPMALMCTEERYIIQGPLYNLTIACLTDFYISTNKYICTWEYFETTFEAQLLQITIFISIFDVYVPVGISNSECINTLWNDSS